MLTTFEQDGLSFVTYLASLTVTNLSVGHPVVCAGLDAVVVEVSHVTPAAARTATGGRGGWGRVLGHGHGAL